MEKAEQEERRRRASWLVEKYKDDIFAFSLNRTASLQDAEDLTQDVVLKLYQMFLLQEIENPEGYIWRVAKHMLANYYRAKEARQGRLVYGEDMSEKAGDEETALAQLIGREERERLRKEIAYLSETQRAVVILYYYNEMSGKDIADRLNLPLGTVKWHLSAARRELKKGMGKMRKSSDLKFNPICFEHVALSGGTGEMGDAWNFFRSALSQNIMYSIREDGKTVEQISDDLGVSPVYVKSELDFLEEYSLVLVKGNRFIANILVDEENEESVRLHRKLYETAAKKIADTLFDRVIDSGYLETADIYAPDGDKNYMMWALMPFLLSWSEYQGKAKKIAFDEVATLRSDGGKNMISASVESEAGSSYLKESGMMDFCGPCWNGDEDILLWLLDDKEWTGRRVDDHYGGPAFARDINLLKRFAKGEKLSEEELAFMLQKGYIRRQGKEFAFAIITAEKEGALQKLLNLAAGVKDEVIPELEAEGDEYKKMVLENTPEHMRKSRQFGLQEMFHFDPWFLLYSMKELVAGARLKPLTKEQRQGACMILIMEFKSDGSSL